MDPPEVEAPVGQVDLRTACLEWRLEIERLRSAFERGLRQQLSAYLGINGILLTIALAFAGALG